MQTRNGRSLFACARPILPTSFSLQLARQPASQSASQSVGRSADFGQQASGADCALASQSKLHSVLDSSRARSYKQTERIAAASITFPFFASSFCSTLIALNLHRRKLRNYLPSEQGNREQQVVGQPIMIGIMQVRCWQLVYQLGFVFFRCSSQHPICKIQISARRTAPANCSASRTEEGVKSERSKTCPAVAQVSVSAAGARRKKLPKALSGREEIEIVIDCGRTIELLNDRRARSH